MAAGGFFGIIMIKDGELIVEPVAPIKVYCSSCQSIIYIFKLKTELDIKVDITEIDWVEIPHQCHCSAIISIKLSVGEFTKISKSANKYPN